MKNRKLLMLAVALLGGWSVSVAQNSAIETVAILMQQDTMIHEENVKAVEQIEKAAENEKTQNWAKMWYYRGRLYLNIYMSRDEETKKMVGDPLNLAYESLLKVEQGEKGDKYIDDARPWLLQTAYQLFNQASESYQMGNYPKVITNYQKIIRIIPYDKDGELMRRANISEETLFSYSYSLLMNDAFTMMQVSSIISELPGSDEDSFLKSQIDMYFDRTLKYYDQFASKKGSERYSASNVQVINDVSRGLLKEANGYIQKLMDRNYQDPLIYVHMSQNYLRLNDTTAALDVIQKGREMFETNVDVINQELDIYLKLGRTKDLIDKSNRAIELDPENKILYFVRGVSYDQLGNTEMAIADYLRTIEIDPYYYDAYFNLGASYTNQTEAIINRMNDPKVKFTQKEYDALAEQVDSLYIKALPYFEKALEVAPSDNYAEKIKLAQTMKGLYQRLVANYPEYMDKFRGIKADIKAWEEAAAQ